MLHLLPLEIAEQLFLLLDCGTLCRIRLINEYACDIVDRITNTVKFWRIKWSTVDHTIPRLWDTRPPIYHDTFTMWRLYYHVETMTTSRNSRYHKRISRYQEMQGGFSLNRLSGTANTRLVDHPYDVAGVDILDVVHLDMIGNDICEIVQISALTNLQTLNLSNNYLTELPHNFVPDSYWPRELQELRISSNHITQLRCIAYAGRNLRVLDISNNLISVISDHEIACLEELEELDISNNPIIKLPNALFDLQKLRKLAIRGCPISTIRLTPNVLPALQELVRSDVGPHITLAKFGPRKNYELFVGRCNSNGYYETMVTYLENSEDRSSNMCELSDN